MKYTGTQVMESASVSEAIIRPTLPVMLAQSIYSMTDMFFIGQTGDPNRIAGVIIVYPICILSQTLGNGFATGGSSYISRLLGAKNPEEARHTSVVSFYRTDCIMCLWHVVFLFKENHAFNTSQKQ